MTSVLIVEDEAALAEPLAFLLKKEGFEVRTAGDGPTALAEFEANHVDIVLLDLMLPGMSGTEVCREIRRTSSVPVIMLTAKDDEFDKVLGLELGADDYVTKPFSKAVLIARVRAALRRPASTRGSAIAVSGLVLDEATRSATIGAAPLVLTRSEFDLLKTLVSHPGRVYSRSMILDAIQNEDKDVTDRTVDTLMVGLRRKLGAWAAHVETIRGVGYRLTP